MTASPSRALSRWRRPRLWLAAGGWAAVVLAAVEAVARQLTRLHPLPWLPDDPAHLVLIPAAGLAALVVAWRLDHGRAAHRGPTAAVFAGLLAVGLVMQLQFGARLQSDGFYYYAYLRSMAFDHDVDFANDYRLLGMGGRAYLFQPTETGHAQSAWTIGPAIVWAPFFAAGHEAAHWLRATGRRDVPLDGTSFPYRQSVVIAGLAYALLGAWFTLRFTRQFVDGRTAGAAVALIMGGSFVLWYALVEPTMTHAPSMAGVAAFAWFWAATIGRRRAWQWAALGLLAGVIGLIRWQNVLFALLPACEAATALWRGARSRDGAAVRAVLGHGLLFTAASTVGFIPQLLAWKAIYGHFFAVSPIGPAMRFLDPHVIEVLFASRNGLLAMSPVLWVAAAGLLVFAWRRPSVGVPIVIVAAAMTYFNASVGDWWGSAGFGGRRFDGLVPLFAPGLAVAIVAIRNLAARRPYVIAAAALGLFTVWNVTFLSAVDRGDARLAAANDFGVVSGEQARQVIDDIGHPFSYPASLWFALANGVRPAAYDYLSGGFLSDPKQPYGRIDFNAENERLLDDGWSDVQRDGARTFRWASHRAGLLMPLYRPAPLDVQVHLRAASPPGGTAVTMTVAAGLARFGPVAVPADWQTGRHPDAGLGVARGRQPRLPRVHHGKCRRGREPPAPTGWQPSPTSGWSVAGTATSDAVARGADGRIDRRDHRGAGAAGRTRLARNDPRGGGRRPRELAPGAPRGGPLALECGRVHGLRRFAAALVARARAGPRAVPVGRPRRPLGARVAARSRSADAGALGRRGGRGRRPRVRRLARAGAGIAAGRIGGLGRRHRRPGCTRAASGASRRRY